MSDQPIYDNPSKLRRPAQDFHFEGMEKSEMAKKLNQENPLSIRGFQGLVDRLHGRYPLLTKKQIGVIIKITLMSLRELLVQGAVLNIFGVVYDLRLYVFLHRRFGKSYPGIKIRTVTPKKVKKEINGV